MAAEKAQVVQANAERQEMQSRLSDEAVEVNAEKQQVAKAQAESNLVRGLAGTARKEKQEARMRAIEAGEITIEDPREARLREQAEKEKAEKAKERAEKKAKREAAKAAKAAAGS